MIKSDAQRERTLAQIDGFRQALAKVEHEASGKRANILAASYRTMLRDLEDQIREYDELKRGKLTIPKVERLDEVAPFITRIRIAKGISQTELGRRLGVTKQVISRYEESDYQTVGMAKLQEILDAIGVKALVTLSS
jgi:HTH-type transcriptional regulator / antitoxin HigA